MSKVLIIGSGVAGLFAADQLHQLGVAEVTIVEKGKVMASRVCPPGPGCDCRLCDVLEGEGGAGSFSDGKITLSATRGTHTKPLFNEEQGNLLHIVDETLRRFVPASVDYPPIPAPALIGAGATAGLRFESYPLLHVGSDGVRAFGAGYSRHLQDQGIAMRTGVEAERLIVIDGRVAGAELVDRRARRTWHEKADWVIAACGMMGTAWLEEELTGHGVRLETGPADIGIRVETTAAALAPFIDAFYDFKVHHTSAEGIELRSFCVNGHGFIVNEYHRSIGIRGVNGHSFLDRQSDQSNLAVMATLSTDYRVDPKAQVREIATQINATANGYPVRQSLRDFLGECAVGPANDVRPSNPKTRPGRLDLLFGGPLREAFASYITALGAALPPLLGADTMLYAPEIKYYNYRVPIDFQTWESTDIAGLFVVGNAAGYTASLSAAALSGIIAGRAIARRHGERP